MNLRKHFRTSYSTIDYIISDLNLNRISDKDIYFKFCVNNRLQTLGAKYDEKLDKILSYIILNCDCDNLPLVSLARMIKSLSKVTNALTKGLLTLIEKR